MNSEHINKLLKEKELLDKIRNGQSKKRQYNRRKTIEDKDSKKEKPVIKQETVDEIFL